MTVGRLREEMANDEFVRWQIYYARKGQKAQLERMRQDAQGKGDRRG